MNEVFEILSMPTKRAVKLSNDWTFSPTFRHFQKVNHQIYVYITPQLFGRWIVQAYLRGTTAVCSLEARVGDPSEIEKLFNLGEKWLIMYGEDTNGMKNDPYNPFNPKGWSGRDITKQNLLY